VRRDAILAAALLLAAVAELLLRGSESLGLQIGISALAAASLVLRSRHLLLALGLLVAGFTALGLAGQDPEPVGAIPPLLLCVYSAGSTLPLRASVLAVTGVALAVFVSTLADEDVGDAFYVTSVFAVPPWVGGRLMGARRRQVEELESLNARLAEERERVAALAAEAERGRIAREMHDVLSHGISLMVLQAGAGPKLLDSDPAAAREAFRSIRQTGERAREELDAAMTGRAVADLDALVEAVPGARLTTRGDVGSLAPGVRVAIQRIVQESLTNAVKHGGGDVSVEVVCDEGAVDLLVRDRGDGPVSPVAGAGRGLIGMRERAAAYGGTLSVGPREAGGFEVRARFPAHPG
jgi:signal transduction histidine kinase